MKYNGDWEANETHLVEDRNGHGVSTFDYTSSGEVCGGGEAILGTNALGDSVEISYVMLYRGSPCKAYMDGLGLDGGARKKQEKGGKVENH
jgi:hypothetical protein